MSAPPGSCRRTSTCHPPPQADSPSLKGSSSTRTAGKIGYDNLTVAVARVIGLSRSRVEAERWTGFRSHWALEAFYCRPSIDGAHEKGGLEGQIGFIGHPAYGPDALRADLDRFTFLLGGDDGEFLLGEDPGLPARVRSWWHGGCRR